MSQVRTIPINSIMNKFSTYENRRAFCTENNWYWPKLPGFDAEFFWQVLQGKKRLMPLGMVLGFSFKYFTKANKFTKRHLLTIFQPDAILMQYLPNGIGLNSLNRTYMLSVLAYVRKDTWYALYNECKAMMAKSNINKYENYGIELHNDVISKIEAFISIDQGGDHRPIRMSKRGVPSPSIVQIGQQQGGGNAQQMLGAGGVIGGQQQGANVNVLELREQNRVEDMDFQGQRRQQQERVNDFLDD